MKANQTQAALDQAAACRAYVAAIELVAVREAIRPIQRRRVAALADMIRAAPMPRRRVNNRDLTTATVAA